jgi:hypothetical protein
MLDKCVKNIFDIIASRLERILVIKWYTITRGFPCDLSPFIYVCMNVFVYVYMHIYSNGAQQFDGGGIKMPRYITYTHIENKLGLKNDDTYRWDVFLFGLSHNTWESMDTWKMKIFVNLLILNLNLPFLFFFEQESNSYHYSMNLPFLWSASKDIFFFFGKLLYICLFHFIRTHYICKLFNLGRREYIISSLVCKNCK